MTESTADADVPFMRRALRLAMNGRGSVEPNPMVGSVIVKNGRVIGEGYHQRYGEAHAEPNALASCTDESPEGATAYVTLEPCCHTNKQTPPCVPRLIATKVARVVVGCLDPNPDVNGKGVAMLRSAGIRVDGPLLENEAKQLIALFLTRVRRSRPYVTVKWAQTADGKVAGAGGQPLQISSPESTQLVHELRARCDAIMVGVGTVLTDDPLLNARYAVKPRHPARFVLDRSLRTPVDARIVDDDSASTTLFHGHDKTGPFRHRRSGLEERGVHTTLLPIDSTSRLSLNYAMRHLSKSGYHDLLVEAGPTLAASIFQAGIADRVWVFRSPKPIDERSAPAAVPVPDDFILTGEIEVGGDRLREYLNPRTDAFFGPFPSADLVLAKA